MQNPSELSGLNNLDDLYKREIAATILASEEKLPYFHDPLSLPIAGLRTYTHVNGEVVTPREILHEQFTPFIVCDLDDNIWPFVQEVVKSINEASGVPITIEHYRKYGSASKVPEWKDNPAIMATRKDIVSGTHPTYYPFVNKAWPDAVKGVESMRFMGHRLVFITARPMELAEVTHKALLWNNIHVSGRADVQSVDVPSSSQLFCVGDLGGTHFDKTGIVMRWKVRLQESGWLGKTVVIDDLLGSFKEFIESGEVMGISLAGDMNAYIEPVQGEIREQSWLGINTRLMEIHEDAVVRDPRPYRLFDCSTKEEQLLLVVNKNIVGTSHFTQEHLPQDAYILVSSVEWINNQVGVLGRIGLT